MPSAETLERFIARVESNAHAEAIEEFYTEGASMRENMKEPRVGRANLVERERKVRARARTRMEELAYQRWEGERIAEEQFFYDPAQLKAP
jgi:ribonucleotide reductase alpha subunit